MKQVGGLNHCVFPFFRGRTPFQSARGVSQINRLEEMHNVDTTVPIDGYHDIRDADITVKVSRKTSWALRPGVSS